MEALTEGVKRNPLDRVHEGLDPMDVVEFIGKLRSGLRGRISVFEIESTKLRLNVIRRRDLFRNLALRSSLRRECNCKCECDQR